MTNAVNGDDFDARVRAVEHVLASLNADDPGHEVLALALRITVRDRNNPNSTANILGYAIGALAAIYDIELAEGRYRDGDLQGLADHVTDVVKGSRFAATMDLVADAALYVYDCNMEAMLKQLPKEVRALADQSALDAYMGDADKRRSFIQ